LDRSVTLADRVVKSQYKNEKVLWRQAFLRSKIKNAAMKI